MRVAKPIVLNPEIRRQLERQARGRSVPVRVALRSRSVLLAAEGKQNIWQGHGLKPHLVKAFKVSRDPDFACKLEAIVGLHLNPFEHALVLRVDDKSQIQALDRTQPGLPLKKGRGQTMTHDYKRNGTATLFAALDTLNGEVFGLCQERHRHQEWLKFLRLID
jgi:transposase